MRPFQKLYDWTLKWAGHRHGSWYLGGLSFAESTFFPIPPDVLLIPMMLARPKDVWRLAALVTITSVLGGLAGFAIGKWAFHWIEPWLLDSSYYPAFQSAVEAFGHWGFWFILVAGFSPVPYKVFTISAGVVGMPLIPFILGSLVGRSARFFLEAFIVRLGGEQAAAKLRGWVDRLGWALAGVVAVIVLYWLILS